MFAETASNSTDFLINYMTDQSLFLFLFAGFTVR